MKKTATALASAVKTAIGVAAAPTTVQMPQAVAELHTSPEHFVPAGTVITDEVAREAGIDEKTIADLEAKGHIKFVEVYAAPAAAPAPAEA